MRRFCIKHSGGRSGNRLERNSQAELNLPGSSSAGETTHYSEVAAPEGCPW